MLIRAFHKLEESLMALFLFSMTMLTFAEVVLRYVFNSGLSWSHEATGFLFAALIFLGMSYGVRMGSHIGVDAVVKLLPRNGQRVAGLIGSALCVVYAAIIFAGAWEYVSKIYMVGIEAEDIHFPRWVFLSVLPIGFGLLTFRFLQVFIRIALGRQLGIGLADEAADAMKMESLTPDQAGHKTLERLPE